jgi:uncharacterized oxidoreductase
MTRGQKTGQVTPEQVVEEFLINFQRDRFESNIGKIKFFRFPQRLFPKWTDNLKKND